MPEKVHHCLRQNEAWAERVKSEHSSLFPQLASGQSPEILWIGCADSRVPETTLLDLKPGDVFVHRNIANVLQPGDLSSQAVIEYAVVYLKVKHIFVCGHTKCGGVNAALANKKLGLIDAWLLPLRELRMRHADELQKLGSDDERAERLVELNVLNGIRRLMQNQHVIDAARDRGLDVHGFVYDVGSGKLRPVDTTEVEQEEKRIQAAFKTTL